MSLTLLVGNPTAQSGKARGRIQRAREVLEQRGADVTLLETAPEGRTVRLVRDAVQSGDFAVVVALGGDGTFAEVARGLLEAGLDVPLGMLPSGTANDQGKSFGLSAGIEALDANIDVVLRGHRTQLDVGRIELLDRDGQPLASQTFFDSAGFGLQAEIVEQRNRDRESVGKIPLLRDLYRDEAVYVGASLKRYLASWVEPVKFTADIEADGQTRHYTKLTDIIVSGTPVYAGNWVLDRASRHDDGRFELMPIHGRRDWLVKTIRDHTSIISLRDHFDTLGLPFTPGFSAAGFDIRLRRPDRPQVASQVDGEEWRSGERFRITVEPRRLALIVPQDFKAPWA